MHTRIHPMTKNTLHLALYGINASWHFLVMLACVGALLSACGSTPTKEQPDTNDQLTLQQTQTLLELAEQETNENIRAHILVRAMDSLFQLNEYDWARTLVPQITETKLDEIHYYTYSIISASLAVQSW